MIHSSSFDAFPVFSQSFDALGELGHSESKKLFCLLLLVICKVAIHFVVNAWVWLLCFREIDFREKLKVIHCAPEVGHSELVSRAQ